MRLLNAAKHFDKLEVRDAYSGKALFKAQFDLFDDSERDAIGIQRRTLSVAPDTTMPARYAVDAPVGVKWVVGSLSNADTFLNKKIREKYTVQRVAGLARICTPSQVIAGTGGSEAYAGLAWLKDWREESVSSAAYPYYEIYFGLNEAVRPGDYVVLNGDVFRVRSSYKSEAGFKVAEADDLDAGVTSITITTSASFVPSTDSFTEATATIQALVVRFQANYEYQQDAAERFAPGDVSMLVSKATVVAAPLGAQVLYDGFIYRVLSAVTESDCWRLHLRP